MTHSEVYSDDDARRYDDGCAEMFTPDVLDPTVDLLASLAPGGRALELAIGTGRVAIPLRRKGQHVEGIELSPGMVDVLHEKPEGADIACAVGDMTTTRVDGRFDLVYLVFNSLSNVCDQDAQVDVFVNAARHLRPGGRFLVELWVPWLAPGEPATVGTWDPPHVCVDEIDVATQTCVSHHYRHQPDGSVRYSAGRFRYATPAELDLMARIAGLRLDARYGDWHRTPFTARSRNCISVWVKPSA